MHQEDFDNLQGERAKFPSGAPPPSPGTPGRGTDAHYHIPVKEASPTSKPKEYQKTVTGRIKAVQCHVLLLLTLSQPSLKITFPKPRYKIWQPELPTRLQNHQECTIKSPWSSPEPRDTIPHPVTDSNVHFS